MNRTVAPDLGRAAPSWSASLANRIDGTESLTQKAFNRLLQQNLPQADSCTAAKQVLFDDFISRYQQVLWERNTESLSGLQVYHQLEFCRLLNREISGLGALENLGDDIGSS